MMSSSMEKVLILDREEESREVLVSEGMALGWDILLPETLRDAEQLLLSDGTVRIAILDLNVPSLFDLLRRISRERMESPLYLIAVAERGARHKVIEALESGAHDFVLKPYDPITLTARLSVARKMALMQECYEETNRVINRYASRMEVLAEERARALLHAERLSTIGLIYASIAHEINNPMSFIAGNIQILEKMLAEVVPVLKGEREVTSISQSKRDLIATEIPEIIASVKSGIGRISKIIRGLKSYSGKDQHGTSECRVAECIARAVELVSQAKSDGIALRMESLNDSLLVSGDAQQLEQVFVNLLTNAIDAVSGDGQGEILVRSFERNGYVVIEVEDNGAGVPERIVEKMWEPFFTTKEVGKGTGLGLSISHGIVNRHGGQLSFRPSVPRGSTFVVTLPLWKGGEQEKSNR